MNLKAKYSLITSSVILLVILLVSFPIVWQVKDALRREIETRGVRLSQYFSIEAKTFIKDVNLQPLSRLKNEPDVIDALICDTDDEILAQLYPGKGGVRIGSRLSIKNQGYSPEEARATSHFQEVFYTDKNTYIYI